MAHQETTLQVEGMHCEGCTQRVSTVLEGLDGVRSVEADLEREEAHVEHDPDTPSLDQMKEAIEKAGYTVQSD